LTVLIKIVASKEGGRVLYRYSLVVRLVDELTARKARWQRIASRYSLVLGWMNYEDLD
tara:strand:- start:255 stop:428 length:174 start_codon:yes stop_codon:yes gene_type:complete